MQLVVFRWRPQYSLRSIILLNFLANSQKQKKKKKTKKIPDTLEDVSNSLTGPMSPAFDYFNQEIFISSSCTSLLHIQVLRPDRKKH